MGPSPELGDHSEEALGLARLIDPMDDPTEGIVSPRRRFVLDNISLSELDHLRRDPRFYFAGAFALHRSPKDQHSGKEFVITTEDEDLLDFFTPSKFEKDLPVAEYAQQLRKKLTPTAPPTHERHGEFAVAPRPSPEEPLEPLEMMPCLGRGNAVRDDHASPTLHRVREVCHRREAKDAKYVEDRKEALEHKFSINAFKSREQRMESQLQAIQQKEMHKMRIMEAEERKSIKEAEQARKLQYIDRQMQDQLARSCLKAEIQIENKRQAVAKDLETWQDRVLRAERKSQLMDAANVRASEERWDKYVGRLWKLGQDRHSRLTTQSQKNDQLRSQLQGSMTQLLAEQQRQESDALRRHTEQKQAAAQVRRENHKARYSFLEKAFGAPAINFDPKHHSTSVDRRSDVWRRHAQEWEKQSRTFSEGMSYE